MTHQTVTLPSTSPRKRWLQFGLRAFLLFVGIVSCCSGWVGLQISRKQRETAVIEQLAKGGNADTYWASIFHQPSTMVLNPASGIRPLGGPGFINRIRNAPLFQTVVLFAVHPVGNSFAYDVDNDGRLRIKRDYISGLRDDDMFRVAKLKNLRSLWLEANEITDVGLKRLSGLPRLEILWLQNTPISDVGIAGFPLLTQLSDLDISSTDVSDASLPLLKKCLSLQHLGLENTQFTPEGIAELRRALPSCRIDY